MSKIKEVKKYLKENSLAEEYLSEQADLINCITACANAMINEAGTTNNERQMLGLSSTISHLNIQGGHYLELIRAELGLSK